MTSSSSIWHTLEREPVLAAVLEQWRAWLDGAQSFEAMRSFLRPEGALSPTYPCPTPCRSCCARRVVEHGSDDFVAVCDDPADEIASRPVQVDRADLVVWSFDPGSCARSISRALRCAGKAGAPVSYAPGAHTLGSMVDRDGRCCAAYLVVPHAEGAIPKLVAGNDDGIVVIVSSRGVIEPSDELLLASHGGRAMFCDETLSWVDDIGLVNATEHPARSGAAALLITAQGRSTVTRAELMSFMTTLDTFDLVVDLTSTTGAGRYRAGRRRAKGLFESTSLSWAQATALTELISSARALRPAEIKSLASINDPTKIVEQARRAVDVKLSRYQWRSIHTLRADDPAAKRFQFDPPPGLSYAVILPVDGAS